MADVHFKHVDEVHCKIICDPSIRMELAENLTFFAPNYRFHPRYKENWKSKLPLKMRHWDGQIRLLNGRTGQVYKGLAPRIKKWCESQGYSVSFDPEFATENVSVHEVEEHYKRLQIPSKFDKRDYQIEAVAKCLRARRRTLVSPTSSGKSLMIYLIMMWYCEKTLIIVPRTGLVGQFEGDLRDYGFTGKISVSTDGIDRSDTIDADVVITTWQALKNGKTSIHDSWYEQFGTVFGDEAHGAEAPSLIHIMSKMTNCKNRFGTTGTMRDAEASKLSIEGLFGPELKTITTREMIDQGYASDLEIKCLTLTHPKKMAEMLRDAKKQLDNPAEKYALEIDYLIQCEKRNRFICNLALSLKGNKLIFFIRQAHGDTLYEMLKDHANVFHIDGDVSPKKREAIRHAMEDEENAILIASLGTTSTGISIKRLHHMIAASPSKSEITVPQSIGRMLRQHDTKHMAYLYDIADDMKIGDHENYALQHFETRVRMYAAEKHKFRVYNINL